MSCTCYNFCLYAYLNDHFRKQFKAMLPCFERAFFQRNRQNGTQQTNQQTITANAGNLKVPNTGQQNTTSTIPSTTKELMTKTGKNNF